MTFEPQPGYIGLTQIGGGVGRVVRVGQFVLAKLDEPRTPDDEDWADYQHAFVYLGSDPSWGDDMIIEAEPGGARVVPLSKYAHADVYWCQNIYGLLQPGHGALVAQISARLEGTPYSYLDYLALSAHKLHLPVPGLRAYIASTRHMICSQLADWCYDLAGTELFHGRWPGYVDPLDLFLLDKRLGAA